MNYQECLSYLKKAEKYGSVLGLSSMRELCRRLQDPQEKCPAVHVAGTNGKGSVIAFLYSMLLQDHKKAGRYTSPALFSYRERWSVSGEMITEERFAGLFGRIAALADQMAEEGYPHPTVFEMETALAYLYFAEEQCEVMLIEVGMGGDLDATNVLTSPALSILTSISMDHTGFLGETLAEIAEKKAGILKKSCPMITTVQPAEAQARIREICRALEIAYREADPSEAEVLEEGPEGQRFRYQGTEYSIRLAGVHQLENAVLAIEAAKLLIDRQILERAASVPAGLAEASWNGRFTILHRDPVFIADGAHNPGAAQALKQSLLRYFPEKRRIFLIGMFADKDYEQVLQLLCPLAEQVLCIETPEHPRALPREKLAAAAAKYCRHVETAGSIPEAVRRALETAEAEDVIVAFGSLSFQGLLAEYPF